GRREVAAEGLLDDHPAPGMIVFARQIGRGEVLHDAGEGLRRRGKVEQVPALDSAQCGGAHQEAPQVFVQLGMPDIATPIERATLEPLPVVGGNLGGWSEAVGNLPPEALGIQVGTRYSEKREALGQQPGAAQIDERRNEQSLGQVAGGAEDDYYARR